MLSGWSRFGVPVLSRSVGGGYLHAVADSTGTHASEDGAPCLHEVVPATDHRKVLPPF